MNAGQQALAQIALKTIEDGFKEGANAVTDTLRKIGSGKADVGKSTCYYNSWFCYWR